MFKPPHKMNEVTKLLIEFVLIVKCTEQKRKASRAGVITQW